MKIKIEKIRDEYYRADFIELTGSPSCGDGKTPEMAVAALFITHIRENADKIKKLTHLDGDGKFTEYGYLEINDIPYEYPYDTRR